MALSEMAPAEQANTQTETFTAEPASESTHKTQESDRSVEILKHARPPQPVNPVKRQHSLPRLSDAELDIARKLSFSAALDDAEDDEQQRVQIVIRIRPLTESLESDGACFRVTSESTMVAQPPKTSQAYRSTGTATAFQFSHIFTEQTQQTALFEATTKPVLDSAFHGRNGLVFAYGVTNSGKTYTISGTDDNPGVLPRALKYVMHELGRRKENDASPVTKITASYLEIYNENVYDLLSTSPVRKRRALRLQDCDGKIQMRGMVEKQIKSVKDADDVLAMGQKNKQVAETKCNMDSSRSHCIFSLYFYQAAEKGTVELRSKVSIVDLAGSERSAKTGATGLRMQEASKINGSLMNLMRCLETLRWNQQHPPALHKIVPFRESKLTRLFQENLIGRQQGPLVMIVAVNPSSHEFDETLRTLKYSAMTRELVPAQKQNAGVNQKPQSTYYDLDGRLRKRRRVSTEGDAEPADNVQPTTSTQEPAPPHPRARESFGRHMKPVRGRPPLRVVRQRVDIESSAIATATALVQALEKELETQRLRALQLEKENEDLRVQLSQTNAEKLQMEVSIRAEVGNEMREQLLQIKNQYRSMLEKQQGGEGESSSSSSSSSGANSLVELEKEREAWQEERLQLEQKVQSLQEQRTECEEEMKRMQLRHQRQIEALQDGNGCDNVDSEGTPESG
ncbi:hypothetical protein Poli38472_004394 [Pythium oligandrum]|uniref:Kinesin-like protein n=1 Tax=Pythium oligandrum TaxID=41045 RepID=A0A8K1FDE0_PYTOL|nr:hypothetical protein Poli38472_004394 [Pythium oligandrum]|eukprot:TMW59325.1 hypothetical protein Poli38472_004394 [Pythium oligandrum]